DSIDADKLVYTATVAANASLDRASHDETKELELSGIKLSSANVEFKGLIRMRMAFTLPEDLEGSEDVFVVYYLEGEHGLEEVTRIALKDGTKITGKSGVSYGYYCPVRTKQFADNLHIRILDANGEPMAYTAGSSWTGIDYTYSTKQYAEAVLGPNSTSSQTMKDLAQAFIDYGTAAKIYFDYDAEGCEVPDRVTAVTAEEMGESASYDKEAMEEMGFSNSVNLDFKADNSLYVYFFLPSGKTASDYTFSIKRGGSETVTTAKLVDAALNKYVVTVNNIAAKNLGEFYDFVVTDNETSKAVSVHASAISYAKLIVESYNNTTDQGKINMMNLAKALYLYSEAAAAYFAGN
ncbi:MAG: hypothetical protein IKZ69_02645, partial [Lachnospiraceae bacterium]|nr:hypothetical protein [Lachnospiraceae bacterium]